MLTCEECGCLVDPEATEIHQDWHEDLVKKSSFATGGLANPRRSKWGDLNIQECNVNKE